MANILRQPEARQKVGVGKTHFSENYVLNDPGDPYVPGTDGKVRRVRPVPLGERNIGFIDDEIDILIHELREFRDSRPLQPRKQPEQLRVGRDAWREQTNKRRAVSNKLEEADPA
jgi:hypothetical protein